MKNIRIWKLLVIVAVLLSLCISFAACNDAQTEDPTQTTIDPSQDQPQPSESEPIPSETEPQETDPEPVILQVGTMSKHMKGKEGDNGLYFMMEPNDIPTDTTWATEYRPTSKDAIQLIRDGQTYDIGKTAAGMIVKYRDTEYYLKLEEWLIRDYFPIRDGDILKIEGIFRNAAVDVMFQIDTTYILISEGLVFFSTEYPEGGGVNVKYVGNPTSHPNGKTTDGIYFKLDKNSVPYDGWTVEYSPATESAVQLIRDGNTYNIGNKAAGTIVKYSDTEYYLKMEKWIIKDFYPIRDGDIIVLNGKFVNSGVSTVFSISKTYISINEGLLTFSTEYPTENTVEVQMIPTMLEHPNGFTGTGVYFSAAEENTLPFDGWSVEYFPREAGCIKLIRDGETYDIANVDAGTIVKFRETEYYLKLEKWIYKNYYPFVDGDIIVVEGKFVNAGLAGLMEIGKTYIAFSGGMAYFSTEYPDGPIGPDKIQGGNMVSHPDGWNPETKGGLFFRLEGAQDAPFATDWSLRYVPTTTDAIKLIRDGVTTNVANTGAETIVKYSEDSYYMEFWPISLKPIVEGDTLVIEGSFVNAANNVVIVIDKTYVTIENGQPVFTTEMTSVIEAGHMQAHDNGWNTNNNEGLYFKLDANEVPYDGWNVEYEPVSAASIKLVRGEETFNIGIPSRGTIVKYSDTEYYLKLAAWTIGEYAPIVPGDELIVEGEFRNVENGVTFNISRSVITVGEDYSLTFKAEEAVDPTINAGLMQPHPNGWNTANNKGMYFSLASNEVPYTDDWKTFYYPTTEENIKLIRGGETVNVAKTDREFVVKYGDTDYYLKLEKWTIGDYFPLVPGDVVIVEGKFNNPVAGVVFNISKTYITIGENYILTFSDQAPEEDDGPIQAGAMSSHTNGFNTSSKDGLYATMAPNAAPHDGWNIEYTPVEAANYKLVRDGQTYDIGIPGRGTLVKYNETDYYLKFGWCVGEYANTITVGDQLIVEGLWRQNTDGEAVMEITKTVITIGEGYVLTFDTEGSEPENPDVPVQENHGPMAAHHEKGWTAGTAAPWGGLYFTMAENDVPFDAWNVRYNPTSAANIKLIRDGVSHDVGNTAAETIVKYSATEYYLEFWPISKKPIQAGDVLVVEGEFTNAASGASLNIAKTTITINADGTATFESEYSEPEQPEIPEEPAGNPMAAHGTNGWTATGGLYFTMAENDAPYDGWNVRYTPTAEGNVKLIRNGQTYDVAHTQRETICKYSATEYYYEFWTLDTYKPVLAGDVLVVEGDFVNAASGATLTVAKTTITFNADGTATFVSETLEPEDPEGTEPESHGPMAAHHEKGWEAGTAAPWGGLYFKMAENDLPFEGWSIRYNPTSAANVKLIRDGVSYDVGNSAAEMIAKFSETEYYLEFWPISKKPIQAGDVLILEGSFTNAASGATLNIAKTTITLNADGTATFVSETVEPEDPEVSDPEGTEPENAGLVMKAWDEKAWNTGSNGGFWFTMDTNNIPADETWVLEYTPVSEDVLKLVRNGATVNIAIPGRGTLVKASDAEYYLKLEWNIGDYANTITVGDQIIVEGDFTNATNGVTFTVQKTTITIGENYVLTFESEEEAEDVIQVGTMTENSSGITSGIIYFSLPDNDLPSNLTKSDFRPVSAGVIKLIRDGVTYDVANPDVKTIVKQTASKYRLLRSALTMELQTGDILVVDGKFTGGNKDEEIVYTIAIGKTYIFIGDGTVSFATELPAED